MTARTSLLGRVTAVLLTATALLPAELVVGPTEPNQFRVNVHRVQAVASFGIPATVFGTAEQDAAVQRKVNEIWAQAGIEIVFSEITEYVSDFAFEGDPDDAGARPNSDLEMIEEAVDAPTTASELDIEMFFVERLPGRDFLAETEVAGVAVVDRPIAAIYVGFEALGTEEDLDAVAFVVSHEIGHCLGLQHLTGVGGNLMTPERTNEIVLAGQKLIIRENDFEIDGHELLVPVAPITHYADFVSENGVIGGPEADDDLDGVSNLMEFVLETDPKSASGVPPIRPVLGSDRLEWVIPRRRAVLEEGYRYRIQVNGNLGPFFPAQFDSDRSTIYTDDGLELRLEIPPDADRFLRLRIDNP